MNTQHPEWIQAKRKYLELLAQRIHDTGFAIHLAGEHGNVPPYGYTIGLSRRGLPELIVIGLPTHVLSYILTELGRRDLGVIADEQDIHDIFPAPTTLRLRTVDVEEAWPLMLAARELLAQPPARIRQIVWPAPPPSGAFPGDANYRLPNDPKSFPGSSRQALAELNPTDAT